MAGGAVTNPAPSPEWFSSPIVTWLLSVAAVAVAVRAIASTWQMVFPPNLTERLAAVEKRLAHLETTAATKSDFATIEESVQHMHDDVRRGTERIDKVYDHMIGARK